MTYRLKDRLALVTGASRGIGAAIAEALAAEGAHVVLTARTTAGLEEVEDRIHAAGGSATIAPADLTDGDSIGRLATAIGSRWDSLDVLVLNAAILGSLMPVAQLDGKEMAQVLTLNVIAQQAMIAAFDPMLRLSDAGRLIALTSSVGRDPRAYWGSYGASKAALEILVASYAQEVENISAIRAAILDPGATATLMRAQAFPGEDQAALKSPAAVGTAVVDLLNGDFITGSRVRVDA
jgi:NAD(P)-dependent dehydrogenase (short-subunit alcohol dehydrogenase family)